MNFIFIFLLLISGNSASLILMSLKNSNTNKFPLINYKNIYNTNYPSHNLKTYKSSKIKKSKFAILYQKLYNVFKNQVDYTYSMSSFPLSYSFNNYNKTKIL